jgi:hypothetical protein
MPTENTLLINSTRETMRLIFKAGVLVLTLTAVAMPAAISAPLESEALATVKRIDVPLAGERSFQAREVIISLPSHLSLEAIDAMARRHRLTRLESQSVGLGRTVHRWGIADGRLVPDVILALKLDGGIDAQPNYIYTLQ